MADTKISALTSASTPLAGTEVLPIVQDGGTDKVSVANLTLGRVVDANGIAFPATQVPSADPNTLDDYEEGTFTPVIIGTVTEGTGTYSYQLGRYTKIGNRVYFNIYIQWNDHTGSGFMKVGGLPFTSQNTNPNYHGITIGQIGNIAQTASTWATASMYHNATRIDFWEVPVGGGANGQTGIDTAGNLTLSGFYQTA